MEFVSDGKRYDTETAQNIFEGRTGGVEWGARGYGMIDILYRSPKGEFFVVTWTANASEPRNPTMKLLMSQDEVEKWLRTNNACAAAYKAAGLEVEDG